MILSEMTWPGVAAVPEETPVVIPIAAHEQHGHHLPLHTDSYLLGEVVRRLENEISKEVLIAPLQWFGSSHHHLDFPGTLSADPRLYLDLLVNEAECFLKHGFKRLVFLNGHGGNMVPGAQAVFELRQRFRDQADLLFLSTTYWEHGTIDSGSADFHQQAMGHACEWETSMMLAIRPDLVGNYAEAEATQQGDVFAGATRGWTMKDRTDVGHIGHPSVATREKGEVLFGSFVSGLIPFLRSVADWDGSSWC